MSTPPIRIAPSILAADFSKLGQEAARMEAAGVDALHIDVMDGHFVKNLTMGPQVVAALRAHCSLFLDVHLMIYHPFDFVESFVRAGAHRITFHFEATESVQETLEYIRRCGIQAGLAFNPETSPSLMAKYLRQIDLLLIMTVHPGFGGQPFLREMLEKIAFAREIERQLAKGDGERGPPLEIQVDGGINADTARLCRAAGANNLVAGTYLFASEDLQRAVLQLKGA